MFLFFFRTHSTNADTHICMSTHPYEYMYAHPIFMSTSEILNRLDFEIHKVDHPERIAVDGGHRLPLKNN
jgi:hypothetical protein